ncbi:MAG TPA: ribonuclease HII, partial [bacterium]|nr:ribonuclease HII [bacterium]
SPAEIPHLSAVELARRLGQLSSVDEQLLRALARDRRASVRALAARYQRRRAREAREAARLARMGTLEAELRDAGFALIAGVDEAGVAPLAGPVVAAAVILPPEASLPGLNDSKQLRAAEREALYPQILRCALAVAVARAEVEEIDRLNILQATRLAHRRALLGLAVRPHLALIDGTQPADVPLPQLTVIDGDALCRSVAAASIVAKVTRDRLMGALAQAYPGYGFEVHKGYATAAHRRAIERLGITPAHRRSFLPLRGQQQSLAIG